MNRYAIAVVVGTWIIIALNVVYFASKAFVARQGLEVRWWFSTSMMPQLKWLALYGKTPEVQASARRWIVVSRVGFWLFFLCLPVFFWCALHLQRGRP